MQTWTYPATYEHHSDDGYVVRFREFPEAITGGDTLQESRELAADALDVIVRDYLAHGRSIPPPREAAEGEEIVPLDPVTASRAALAFAMAERKVSNVALAKMLGKSEGAVRRLVDGSTSVNIDAVLQALAAVGSRVALTVVTA